MGIEIEHKYLVETSLWRPAGPGTLYRQGYLSSVKERVARVRIADELGFVTIKGESRQLTRLEFEYPIPLADAVAMLDQLCERPIIEKTRHREVFAERTWEIDVFHGDNEGLLIAEVEVASVSDRVVLPAWAGAEVSDDPRYFNNNLIKNPYKNWRKQQA